MPKKLERCVRKLRGKHKKSSAYAICTKSIKGKRHGIHKKRKK